MTDPLSGDPDERRVQLDMLAYVAANPGKNEDDIVAFADHLRSIDNSAMLIDLFRRGLLDADLKDGDLIFRANANSDDWLKSQTLGAE